jgi:GH24 family phage-related lysozyme (muramidase)
MTNPVKLRDFFTHFKGEPHQLAAVEELQAAMPASLLKPDSSWVQAFRAAPAAKDPLPPAWQPPALKIIKQFEGCHLHAYLCPAGVATLGWGATQINGKAVQMGDTITQAQADDLLRQQVLEKYGPGVLRMIPSAAKWKPDQIAAITSFAYSVGLGALEGSTLRQRLNAGEPAAQVVAQELPRWNKGNKGPLPGLIIRRDAEVQLFTGKQLQQQTPQPPAYGNPLTVPWYSQRDSATPQAMRMCFSSSCAMLLETLKPGTLKGPNGDDQYLQRVQQYGDTTDPNAQIKALASYGVNAAFTQKADFKTLEQQIKKGIPVPCGYLHRGPVSKPAGGGHWLIVVGYTAADVIVHDPFGEADLVNGTTLNKPARYCHYSRQNFGRRWMVDGPGTGWAILATR